MDNTTGFPCSELLKIKGELESTRDVRGRSIAEREFQWAYDNQQRMYLLKEVEGYFDAALFGSSSTSVYELPYDNTLAAIHNHPSGRVHPSMEDVITYMNIIDQRPNVKYSLIASSKDSIVSGFCVMEYKGKPSNAKTLKTTISEKWKTLCEARHDAIRNGKYYRYNLRPGDNIFTLDEEFAIIEGMWKTYDMTCSTIAMPGYDIDGWQFAKKGD